MPDSNTDYLLLDSITDAGSQCHQRLVISGSHGGLLPATLASQAMLRGVIFNDAGVGLQQAGRAGVRQLDTISMAAATVSHHSCHIGSAASMLARGVISFANQTACALGVGIGQTAQQAIDLLQRAIQPTAKLPALHEARRIVSHHGTDILLVDSASLVTADDTDALIITGSHGALIGGNPARALKANARFAAFNDAGMGLDNIGQTRLPALQQRNVAAVTYRCDSAIIGNASSALQGGVISAANGHAVQMGATLDLPLREFLAQIVY